MLMAKSSWLATAAVRTAAIAVGLVAMLAAVGSAQSVGPNGITPNADDYRGGWRTEGGDESHTFEFSIRDTGLGKAGAMVRGIYCTNCSDATTLAFIDGRMTGAGLDFVITHVNADGSTAYQDQATAKFAAGKLTVTGTSGGPKKGRFEYTLIKDPRGPAPLPVIVSVLPKQPPVQPIARAVGPTVGPGPTAGPFAAQAAYEAPGPWREKVTEKDVIGAWLGFRVGIDKQYFIIRKVGNGLRGMVCGRCDNPYTMAALDEFELAGDVLKFNIRHEDWGDGELPTFAKHVTCKVGGNELRCTTSADHQGGAQSRPFSLVGPVAVEATRGNR
jgi:hypothetical protein